MNRNGKQHFPTEQRKNFYAIGLSYQKADAETRGHFSLSETAQDTLLKDAKKQGFNALSVISTCNRTELYGFADTADEIIDLLCEHTLGTREEFDAVSYCYSNKDAMQHLRIAKKTALVGLELGGIQSVQVKA